MNARLTKLAVSLLVAAVILPVPVHAGLTDLLKDLGKSIHAPSLSGDRIAQGLREALRIGAENAVNRVSKTNGYLGNPDIRIPLPQSVRKVEKYARMLGYGEPIDGFLESMNHAAEHAAPKATELFVDSVSRMSLEDAQNILNGPDDAATTYLRNKTFDSLVDVFTPRVHESMAKVEVTRRYQELTSQLEALPVVGSFKGFDLDRYVTEKSLDGLFFMIAREEKKIRQDPAARVTDLLKEVFGRSR